MLILTKNEPAWVDLLPGVRVQFAPVTRAMKRKARQAAREVLGDVLSIEDVGSDQLFEMGEAFSRALIRLGIVDWDGIGDPKGKAMAVSAETVEMFLENEDCFEAADALYVMPVVERDREKNALSASPDGTGKAATRAKTTAGSAARPTKKAAAKSAPTARKRQGHPKARKSGN